MSSPSQCLLQARAKSRMPRQKPAHGPRIHCGPNRFSIGGNQRIGAVGGGSRGRHGRQSTGYVLFVHGVPVFASCIDFGGQHISEEIARAFNLRKFEAERLKIRYGSVYDSLQADVDLPVNNGETREPVSKFSLNHIVRLRVSTLLQAVNDRLKGAGYSIPSGEVVLTGGGSLLPGVRELASHLLASEVRTARPINLNGLSAGNALSALVGGCLYAEPASVRGRNTLRARTYLPESSYASRISQWLRTSFL